MVKSLGTIQLQAYPQQEDAATAPVEILTSKLFTDQNAQRVNRQRFGRSISMDRIETSLRAAYVGSMRDITDLSRETIDADPHLASILQKRFGSLSSLPWEVQPPVGQHIDPERAMYYAEVVRAQLNSLKGFRQNLEQLAWALFDNRAAQELHWLQVPTGEASTSDLYGNVGMVVQALAWIHPRRLSYGPHRELRVQDERVDIGGNFTPSGLALEDIPDKFIWWKPQLFGEYAEREGLGQRCMYWSFFKRYSARERMILLELFGKPWRIIEVDEESSAGAEELENADTIIDNLGSSYTARMPRGTRVHVEQPQKTAGAIHDDVIKSVDAQLSKLVLGQTGTTDGIQIGLNGGSVMDGLVNEQLGILVRDARQLSELIETMLTDRIIALNFGESAVTHAPKFILRADRPTDRNEELKRLESALKAGLSVAQDEAYEASGFRVPTVTEVVIAVEQPPTPPAAANPPAPRAITIYPIDKSPVAGEQLPAPPVASADGEGGQQPSAPISSDDAATVTTVGEARNQAGLPPFGDERDQLTVAEFEAQGNSINQAVQSASDAGDAQREGSQDDRDRATEELDSANDLDVVASPQITTLTMDIPTVECTIKKVAGGFEALSEDGTRSFGVFPTRVEAEDRLRQVEFFKTQATLIGVLEDDDAVVAAKHKKRRYLQFHLSCGCATDIPQTEAGYVRLIREHAQPSGDFGSSESILDKSQTSSRSIMRSLAGSYFEAIDNARPGALGIFNSINAAAQGMDITPLAREIERRMLQSFMLGAIDSAREAVTDSTAPGDETITEVVTESEELAGDVEDVNQAIGKVLTSSVLLATTPPDFSKMNFRAATKFFKDQKVVTRTVFDQMSAAAKRRSFTVAGVMNTQMLQTIRSELSREIAGGADLATFAKAAEDRLKSAGFLAQVVEFAPGQTALSASHVETVFRTNVLNAYNRGRAAQQQSPAMLRARPVWEIRAVGDDRTRATHKAASGRKLSATDPFWQSAYPPFGFNCRCRVVTRGRSELDTITTGTMIAGLPDSGFSSGIGGLL
jgi:SPP1 gp7 family putative phage head morphogenesis protein